MDNISTHPKTPNTSLAKYPRTVIAQAVSAWIETRGLIIERRNNLIYKNSEGSMVNGLLPALLEDTPLLEVLHLLLIEATPARSSKH